MKSSNIIISFIIFFIKFTTITISIQIHENTTSDNDDKNSTNVNTEPHTESFTNINSKGPVLYSNNNNKEPKNEEKVLQNIKENNSIQSTDAESIKNNNNNNITSSVKKPLKKLKKQKLRQTNIESSRSIHFKHNIINNHKEFIPSPEIKLPLSEENINQIKENESFQPSDMMIPLSVSLETVKPFIMQHHTIQQQQYYPNNIQQQQQHQQPAQNIQYIPNNYNKNNQYKNTDQMADDIPEKDIIYGKQNSQLSAGYNYKQNNQKINNKIRNNIINWPSNEKLPDINDSHENHKEKMHTKKSASSSLLYNKNQYRQSNPHVQQSSYYDENLQLPETKIIVHQSNNDDTHDIYNNPNIVENTKELIENQYYTNNHQNHNYQQQFHTLPVASEHPYQFESVSQKDAQYYEYQNVGGISQHHNDQQQVNHQYGQHYQHNAHQYENGPVYSNENGVVGVVSNYGETGGHSNYGELGYQNTGYHNVRHNHHNVGKDIKKIIHWKKIATIFASIIPIGLLFSALTPNVVVINPNATALSKSPSPITLVQPIRQRSLDDEQHQKNNNETLSINIKENQLNLMSNKNISLNSKCIERSICELASDGNNSHILKKLLEEIQRNYRRDLFSSATLSTSPATQFTKEEFINAAKGDNCKNYECDMLT